jgi:urate oxidase
MGIVLGPNRYGKAETRVVRVYRDSPRHEIRDVNVSTSLRGDFADAHIAGDQAKVLPTDTQKNTCFAFAKQKGIGEIEDFGLELGRHFVEDIEPVTGACIEIEEYAWDRIVVDGVEHDHSWVRRGGEIRTATVDVAAEGASVVGGLRDLTLLKSTGSEFAGFLTDGYTTLAETSDRVLATSLTARWRYTSTDLGWAEAYTDVRRLLLTQFATVHSYALQQTLWEMGKAVLETHQEIAEISLTAPNKHHLAVDLAAFGFTNDNEVFHATDRPYGLIECTVGRDA